MRRGVALVAAAAALAAAGWAWASFGAVGPALPLRALADVPLSGSAGRFDYASLDGERGVLWLAHMADGAAVAVDVRALRIERTVAIAPEASVRGILVARGKVYAAAQGLHAVVVLDAATGRRLATVPAGDVDGLAYDPVTQRLFVSDESGGRDTVIDGRTDRRVGAVELGGEAGNTQYDPVSHHVFVGVQTRNEVAEIDPAALRVLRRYPLPGCASSHSVAVDSDERAVYVGCQQNAHVVRLDLRSGRVVGAAAAGIGLDVMALDPGLRLLYVGSESGIVTVYDVAHGALRRVAQAFLALHAHVVAVDPVTHRVFFPLQDVGGKPVLRVMEAR